MLENPNESSSSSSATIKRYAPPNQRNRSLTKRKSGGEKFEKMTNIYGNDPEKNLVATSRNAPSEYHGWKAAINALNDPLVDLADRPVMYSGSNAPAWGSFRLPHQMIPPTTNAGSSGTQRDFLGELRRAIRDANASANS